MPVREAQTDDDILACFRVMAQLRPHLAAEEFVPRVRRQTESGYRLAFVEEAGRAVAVAGFRLIENLAWGRFLYVDDLVTDESERSRGRGEQLFEWLVAEAKRNGCGELHLDSGVQRFAAHRFYLRQRLDITCHHFAMKLPGG
jgi:GNAT superfamily N-acetyltransferase